MRRRIRPFATLNGLLLALTAVAWLPGAAIAEEPGTLTGETLIGTPSTMTTSAQCHLGDSSTFTFRVSGVAVGAYSGTFTEEGRVTVGPQATAFPTGSLISFDSTFTIDSATGTVTGSKHLVAPGGTGSCITTDEHGGAAPQYFVEFSGATLEYTARITGPAGTWTETGRATALGHENRTSTGLFVSSGFGETFETATRSSQPAVLTLNPTVAINPVGTTHTVTATVTTSSGAPVSGVLVRFTVTGSTTTDGSCTTGPSGECSFTYEGPALPGSDVITAYADVDNDNVQDPTEPGAPASKAWVLPVSTPGHVTGGGQISYLGRDVTFGFEAKSSSAGLEGECTVIDHAAGVTIKCLTVTALVQTPTHAVFFGSATVSGQPTTYRIDVDDLSESGAGADTFKIQTDSGYLAGGVLTQGNVEIHSS